MSAYVTDTQAVGRFARPSVDLSLAIVRIGTAALFLAAVGFIVRFAVNAPYVDEWDLTQVVLGGMTLGEWSFTRLNEHFFIPANAIWYLTMKASGLDFRAGMLVNLCLHLAASIILMKAARRIRGFTSVADLVFPAALLHWGHAYNLLMSYQIVFGFFALSAALMLRAIVSTEPGQESRTATRASLAQLLLMLSGGMGIAFVPPLAVWIAVLAWRGRAKLPFAFLMIAIAYTAFVLLGAPKTSAAPREALPASQLAWCVVQYFGIGTGLWYEGPHWPRNGIAITIATAGVMLALAVAMFKRKDGGRTAGLLLFLAGHVAVALGIAFSRGGALAERYVTISAIGLTALMLAMTSLTSCRCWRIAQLAIAAALVTANFTPGERFGHAHRSLYRSFEKDLKSGMPIGFLRDKYQARLRVGENLEPAILRLKEHGIREFSLAVPTPAMIETGSVESPPSDHILGLLVEIVVTERTTWCELKLVWDGGEAVVYPPILPGKYRLRFWLNGILVNPRLVETSQPSVIVIKRACWLR